MSVSKFLMFFLIVLMLIQPVQAKAVEKAVADDALACLNATTKLEEKYQIKEHLLTTISSVETGRWNAKMQQSLAWPWTVNSQGKGTYYKTKAEAIRAVKKLQAQGVRSIDVGCMQINLAYHPDAFKNLDEAFDPYKNAEYAAKFLKNLYESRDNDWIKAAMAYHSSVPKKALRYKNKLVSAYEKVKQAHNTMELKKLASMSAPENRQLKAAVRKRPQTLRAIPANAEREARLIADSKAWREAKLEEYRQNKQY